MKNKQRLKRGVEQSAAGPRRRHSELPVIRAATGQVLPALANEDIERILAADETGVEPRSGR